MTAVGRLYREVSRELARRRPFRELTEAQMDLLVLVCDRPDLRVGEAARALALASNTVSTLAQQLVTAGYLSRVRDPEDARVVRLTPSAVARDQILAWRGHRGRLVGGALRRLVPALREAALAAVPALDQLVKELRAHADADSGHLPVGPVTPRRSMR